MTEPLMLFRRWWPVPALLILALVVQKTLFENRYEVSGHAADHLASSTAIFFAVPIVVILLWVLDADRFRPFILAGCFLWLVALIGVLVGNVRVVDAIGTADWNYREADVLGPARPGYESGHDLAQVASFVAVAGALLLIGSVWRAGAVSTRVAIVCAVLSMLIPPWIFPGVGVVVLTFWIVRGRQRASDTRLPRASKSPTSVPR
ncbi:MAG: hypothetical protein M3P18_20450, partial [Actinomycetota bacterium]|nr:hypothetical protein [Actinomycetota bacterium]